MLPLDLIRVILRILLANRAALIAENLALRQQLAVVSHAAKRPRLRQRDRIFWVWCVFRPIMISDSGRR
jgi:hypothetical protein